MKNSQEVLELDNVCTYIGRTEIVKDASFQIKAGDIIGLIGPNGAGKTTVMKTILGLTKFTGKITMSGAAITENNHHALEKVGALIEHPAIYPFLTGEQNLELYSHHHQDMVKIISELGMDSYIKSKAKGYSLGMKQKLGIAIALLNNPKLVILDEPMNGLDIEATIGVRKLIKKYADRGTAFLISSHILSELQKVMTRVLLISGGKIILNQSIGQFEAISHQKYKLTTENDEQAEHLFKTKGINFKKQKQYLIVGQEDIFKIQDELAKKKLHLKETLPIEANFEQIVVDTLNKERD